MIENDEHRFSIVSNAILEGAEPTFIYYDSHEYYVFADDVDGDAFLEMLETGIGFDDWIPRLKPVCLHCLANLSQHDLQAKLDYACTHHIWSHDLDAEHSG